MEFKIHKEVLIHKRFLQLWNRNVEFPNGKTLDWEIVGEWGEGPHFAVIFPFNSKTKTVRIIKEYCQGINEMRFGLPAGRFESKHENMDHCATMELEEEGALKDGRMFQLLSNDSKGIPELKWSRNRFIPYLNLDAVHDPSLAENKDDAEFIEYKDVSVEQFLDMCSQGEMMLTAVQTGLMAIKMLKSMNINID